MNDLLTESLLINKDPNNESTSHGTAPDDLRPFFEEADLIKQDIASIRILLLHLQETNNASKSLHDPTPLPNADILGALQSARTIRRRLNSMDRDGTIADRTKTSVTNGLRKNLRDLMMNFELLRQEMMDQYKEMLKRRYLMVTGEVASEEEIERMIDEGEEIVRKTITGEAAEEMQGRYLGAKEVERSLRELHEVFLGMAVMVEAQGEELDDIEHNVAGAAHYVRVGVGEMGLAKEERRSSRRWVFVGIGVFLLVVLAIAVPIIVVRLRRR